MKLEGHLLYISEVVLALRYAFAWLWLCLDFDFDFDFDFWLLPEVHSTHAYYLYQLHNEITEHERRNQILLKIKQQQPAKPMRKTPSSAPKRLAVHSSQVSTRITDNFIARPWLRDLVWKCYNFAVPSDVSLSNKSHGKERSKEEANWASLEAAWPLDTE